MIMNTLKVKFALLSLLATIAVSVLMTSCEQAEIIQNSDVIETANDLEGFKSTTDNADNPQPLTDVEMTVPVLHHRFNGDMSREEVEAQWTKMVADYISTLEDRQLDDRGVSTEWFYSIYTHTGTQSNNGTDDDVYAYVNFRTDKGYRTQGAYLDNFGDDREEGDWDMYLIKTHMPGQAVNWVEARWGQLSLKGTDGWFVKRFNVYVFGSYQTVSSNGYSHINSYPDVWLDNASSSGWNSYVTHSDTKTVRGGRLNF